MVKFIRHAQAFAVLVIITLLQPAQAREMPTTMPEREGMDSERLDRIGLAMNRAVDNGVMVGGLGMIARNGRVVYTDTWGLSDREKGTPMEMDKIFRIYSMSKPITGVALMMLYEEGKFFLNDPVAMYLPELANLQVAVSTADGVTRAVSDGTQSTTSGQGDTSRVGETRKPSRQPTVRDLMTHTAGFTYGFFGNTEVDKLYRDAGILANPNLSDFVEKLGQIPLQYEPGTRWHYSVSVDVQGALVERLSGMTFGEFLQQRLFTPMGMADTSFIVPNEKLDRLAQLYSPAGTAAVSDVFLQQNNSTELVVASAEASEGYLEGATFEGGGGGLVSTARDYMRFSQMMLNDGVLDGRRVLSRKTVELMTMNHLGDIPMGFGGAGVGFGLDFAVVLNPGDVGEVSSQGEFNWGGAAGTRFWIDPQEELIGVFMVQSIPHRTRLAQEFKTLTYQAIED